MGNVADPYQVNAVGVLAARDDRERRVALVPEGVRRLKKAGLEVVVEAGSGDGAWYPDHAYIEAGAAVAQRAEVINGCQVLLCVARPPDGDLERLRAGQAILGMLDPTRDPEIMDRLVERGVVVMSLEAMPRTISRAQAYDVLTSQAGVAGYRAALLAAVTYGRYFPLLMTAAGTSRPARVLVLGAGVAGLSAIGTARRLGAVVTGYDVRPEAQGEVESLGARFMVLDSVGPARGEGGYARALDPDQQRTQREVLESRLTGFDIVITTAAVPGQRPPLLVSAGGLDLMAPGSVVVDGASGPHGGNVEGSVAGQTFTRSNGVTVIGAADLPSGAPTAASDAFSSNLTALLGQVIKDGRLTLDPEDEVVAAITHSGLPAGHQGGMHGERITAV